MNLLDKLPQLPYSDGLNFLEGITVLDLTTSIAGPYSTQLLGDLGAEIIKVEKRDGGDDARHWGPPFLNNESLWFISANRNKESLTLDLTLPAGRRILHELVKQADVIVMNTASRIQAKLGIDYQTLHAINPSLIHVSITGFGLEGVGADLPCYDLIAEGYSGIMDLTGEAARSPQKIGTPASDLLAGQDAALAILAALHGRQRTGTGTQIDISMVASSTRFMASRIVPYLGSGKLPQRSGGTDSVVAIYQVFDTADYPITLGLGNDAIWHRFWAAVGQPEYGTQDSLNSNIKRCELRQDIVAKIAKILAEHPREKWLDLFARHRIPAGPINTLAQLVDDPLVQANNQLYCLDSPSGPIPQVGLGIRFDGGSETARRAPPKLGEDTERILRERLAMSADDIASLKKSKVI